MAVEVADINPFGKFDIGLGAVGNMLILLAIGVVVVALVGWLVYWRMDSKKNNKRIHLFKIIGNVPTRIGVYRAGNVPISLSGDSLWFVKGVKRWIAPATIQSAPNEYWHWERQDGEWINFSMKDLDEIQKKAGVRFIQQDMRTQRVATGQILEQRLIKKGFWEKYKDMIVHLVFYIIVSMLMIVTFWQWGTIVEKISGLLGGVNTAIATLENLQCVSKSDNLIPALVLPFIARFKK